MEQAACSLSWRPPAAPERFSHLDMCLLFQVRKQKKEDRWQKFRNGAGGETPSVGAVSAGIGSPSAPAPTAEALIPTKNLDPGVAAKVRCGAGGPPCSPQLDDENVLWWNDLARILYLPGFLWPTHWPRRLSWLDFVSCVINVRNRSPSLHRIHLLASPEAIRQLCRGHHTICGLCRVSCKTN